MMKEYWFLAFPSIVLNITVSFPACFERFNWGLQATASEWARPDRSVTVGVGTCYVQYFSHLV